MIKSYIIFIILLMSLPFALAKIDITLNSYNSGDEVDFSLNQQAGSIRPCTDEGDPVAIRWESRYMCPEKKSGGTSRYPLYKDKRWSALPARCIEYNSYYDKNNPSLCPPKTMCSCEERGIEREYCTNAKCVEITDTDQDGIPDPQDNCPFNPNPGQEDDDYDSVGNVCDNCPRAKNADQSDTDHDSVGDVCDKCQGHPDQDDADGDQIPDKCDNCPNTPNPGQEDNDGDGIGNMCDNCPNNKNPGQEDSDGDGSGDVCDPEPDDSTIGDPNRFNLVTYLESNDPEAYLSGLIDPEGKVDEIIEEVIEDEKGNNDENDNGGVSLELSSSDINKILGPRNPPVIGPDTKPRLSLGRAYTSTNSNPLLIVAFIAILSTLILAWKQR